MMDNFEHIFKHFSRYIGSACLSLTVNRNKGISSVARKEV